MKYIIRVSTFLLISLPLLTYGQTGWNTVKGENYSISHPKNWDLDDSGAMGSQFFLYSRLVSIEDNFKENINLITQDLSAHDISLDQFVNLSTDQVVAIIKEGNIISSDRISEDGVEKHHLIYTGKQNDYILRFEQQFWIIDQTAYILTFTSKLEDYEKYSEIGNKMIKSFKIQ